MKKAFQTPELEMTLFEVVDVITTSSGGEYEDEDDLWG